MARDEEKNIMEEIWKDIEGYEGYQVSNLGRVRSFKHKNVRILSTKNRGGYRQVQLCKDSTKKLCYVHRLVAEAFIPNPDDLPQVNHKDENKANNFVNNLEWCTAKYNLSYGTGRLRAATKISGLDHIKTEEERKDTSNKSNKRYKAQNHDKVKVWRKTSYERRKEKIREYAKKYRERLNAYMREYRKRRKDEGNPIRRKKATLFSTQS